MYACLPHVWSLSMPVICLVFHRSYIPATIRNWNLLPSALRSTTSRADFARQVWQRLGAPEPPPSHSYGTKLTNTHHTRLRVGLSTLNAHLFQICQPNTTSPSCRCGHHNEDTSHYTLWCPLYHNHRLTLFNDVHTLLPNFKHLSPRDKLDTLLFCKNVVKGKQLQITHLFHAYIAPGPRLAC